MRSARLNSLVPLMSLLLMAGCSGLMGKVNTKVTETQEKSDRLLKEVGKSEPGVVYESGLWLGKTAIKLEQPEVLPPIFSESATFDRTVQSLSEVAERITLRSGMPTKVTPDAAAAAQRTLQSNAAPVGAAGPGGATGLPPLPSPIGMGAAGVAGQARPDVRIVYSGGTFKGLLDTVAARFGVFWKYTNGGVRFFYTDTRSFQINAIPGDSALSAGVASSSSGTDSAGGGGGGGGNGGTSGGQDTRVKSELSVYTSIEKAIGSMLSPYGKVVASPATGTITVTDTPDTLDHVAHFVENENKSLSRQVMISVTVLSVNLSDGDNYGINWNLVYGDLFKRYGVENSYAIDQQGLSSFSAAVLNTASSKFAGSKLMIEALSTQGNVRRETTASVATLNNQPVPVQVATQKSYLKSSQTTITANVGSTTSLNPGVVTSGFNMTILPHVLNDGMVMLQFSADISSLRGINRVESGDSAIETPEVDTRNFLQRVAMKSGETLVISGFEQLEDSINRQGVGAAANFLLGGGLRAQSAKQVIVILITPLSMNTTL